MCVARFPIPRNRSGTHRHKRTDTSAHTQAHRHKRTHTLRLKLPSPLPTAAPFIVQVERRDSYAPTHAKSTHPSGALGLHKDQHTMASPPGDPPGGSLADLALAITDDLQRRTSIARVAEQQERARERMRKRRWAQSRVAQAACRFAQGGTTWEGHDLQHESVGGGRAKRAAERELRSVVASQGDVQCAICTEDITKETSDTVMVTACHHAFHKKCWIEYVQHGAATRAGRGITSALQHVASQRATSYPQERASSARAGWTSRQFQRICDDAWFEFVQNTISGPPCPICRRPNTTVHVAAARVLTRSNRVIMQSFLGIRPVDAVLDRIVHSSRQTHVTTSDPGMASPTTRTLMQDHIHPDDASSVVNTAR